MSIYTLRFCHARSLAARSGANEVPTWIRWSERNPGMGWVKKAVDQSKKPNQETGESGTVQSQRAIWVG